MITPLKIAEDENITIRNRERLLKNTNLMYWYENLYSRALGKPEELIEKKILEIGSGTSPLSHFYPNVITSDIMRLDYLDHVLDCHEIHKFNEIQDGSIDIITLTNVLHHLRDPMEFLRNAVLKLNRGGKIIMTEPFFSFLSYPVFKYIHHEALDMNVEKPVLDDIEGPLRSANQALPYIIFCMNSKWREQLSEIYDIGNFSYYTSASYFITGGISRRFSIPEWLYKVFFKADDFLAARFPRIFSSFFIITLSKIS